MILESLIFIAFSECLIISIGKHELVMICIRPLLSHGLHHTLQTLGCLYCIPRVLFVLHCVSHVYDYQVLEVCHIRVYSYALQLTKGKHIYIYDIEHRATSLLKYIYYIELIKLSCIQFLCLRNMQLYSRSIYLCTTSEL